MWLLLRFLTVVAVYVWRLVWRKQGADETEEFRGLTSLRKVVRHKRRFRRAFLGLPYDGPLRFALTTERGWDAFFKGLGLAVEQQVGDAAFDAKIYLTCDQPALGSVLRGAPEVRAALLQLFTHGVTRVFADGENLWAETTEENHDRTSILAAVHALRAVLLPLDARDHGSRLDAFFWKAVAVEALIWSVAAYGVPGFFELTFTRNTLYLAAGPVFLSGFGWSVAVFTVLFGMIVLLFRGSSRGHRILVESFTVLLVGVPFSTVQAVSDVNIHLDRSPPVVLAPEVVAKSIEIRRNRRSRSTHYYLHLGGDRGALPERLEVASAVFHATAEKAPVRATLRSGRLGHGWIESIGPGG